MSDTNCSETSNNASAQQQPQGTEREQRVIRNSARRRRKHQEVGTYLIPLRHSPQKSSKKSFLRSSKWVEIQYGRHGPLVLYWTGQIIIGF